MKQYQVYVAALGRDGYVALRPVMKLHGKTPVQVMEIAKRKGVVAPIVGEAERV